MAKSILSFQSLFVKYIDFNQVASMLEYFSTLGLRVTGIIVYPE